MTRKSISPNCNVSPEQGQLLFRRVLEIYQQNLTRTPHPRTWLAQRGINDQSIIDRAGGGWSNGRLRRLLPSEPTVFNQLVELGILTRKGGEIFAGCLVFPVHAPDGRIASLLGYTDTGEVRILPGHPSPLWGIAVAKTAAHVLLVPDVLDALSLISAGHTHVLALHPQFGAFDPVPLRTWGVQRLTIVHGDTPAALATIAALQNKLSNFPHDVAHLSGESGANAMLCAKGAQVLSQAVLAATKHLPTLSIPGMQPMPGGFILTIGSRTYEVRGLQTSPTRMKCTLRSVRGTKMHVDTLDFFVARARRQLILELVRLHEESADVIEADVTKLLTACELRAAQPDLTTETQVSDPVPEGDRREAEAMGKDPKLIPTILDDYERCGLVGERANKLLSYLAMTSRKMPRPLAIMNLSGSGTGKSALQDATVAFCPPEEVEKRTNISAKALFHREKDSLRHKFLAFEEGKGVESAAYPLRILISTGELTTEVATKDPASGRLIAVTNHVRGPVAVSLTTTQSDADAETRSRFFVISADESPEQTEAILESQRQQHTLEGIKSAEARAAIYRRHHAFQRLLRPLLVLNPHAARLCGMQSQITARRDQPKLLGLVSAVAFLRQMAKPIKQHGATSYVEVDEADLKIASDLLRALLTPGSHDLSRPALELLRTLDRMRKAAVSSRNANAAGGPREFSFTRRQVREFAGWERSRVHRYLSELSDAEYVLRDRGRRGLAERYVLAWDGDAGWGTPSSIFPFPPPSSGNEIAATA